MYLITGGAGFIGSNIARRLAAKGERVRVLDNLSTGRLSNLNNIRDDIDFIEGDVNDSNLLKNTMAGARYVIHLAAIPSVQRSIKDPIASNRSIVDGTLNVLVEARDAGVKRIVLASSSSVYGSNKALPKQESFAPAPISPYATAKYTSEMYAVVFAQLYDIETVSLRYFNVFGPLQDPRSEYAAVIPRFITRMLTGERPVIFGTGEQTRDFTFIENVIDANLYACLAPKIGRGEVINIACGRRYSLNQLVKVLNTILGTEIQPEYFSPRPGDIEHSLADITRARQLMGYNPKIDLYKGLSVTVDYFKSVK